MLLINIEMVLQIEKSQICQFASLQRCDLYYRLFQGYKCHNETQQCKGCKHNEIPLLVNLQGVQTQCEKNSRWRKIYLFISFTIIQPAIKYITMIEGMVNRTFVPCEDQTDTKQQVDILTLKTRTRTLQPCYLHSYIKINSQIMSNSLS